MLHKLKIIMATGFLGIAVLTAVPAKADVGLHFGGGDGRIGVHIGGVSRHYFRDDYWRGERRCTPERALDKVRRLGVHRARIDFVGRHEIGIVGRSRGDRVYVTFARAPHCPVIG